ncbi:MAG: histidinol-phosphate transaminase [Cytophagales bacterium]|nr:histidinol-phosphate transaminase [Cytophagales bacterium]MDW8385084.1 histidinol-phosphate transaminase [Flammeovirgaceae bacterium]
MIDFRKIVRPHIWELKPYSSARDEYTGTHGIFLDANENPYSSVTGESFNRYPDPYQRSIKEMLATLKGVSPNQIFLGNGSDEAIDLLIRLCCEPHQDNILIMPPTYGMYAVSAEINCVKVKEVLLTPDFQLRVAEILQQVDAQTKIIFVCSPNNPTGNCFRQADILELLEHFHGLVVIDEAYIDFARIPSFITLLGKFPNLVVLQTFSKAWGMAGLRVGMAYASPTIIQLLNKIKPPYNIGEHTQQKIMEALNEVHRKDEMVAYILAERQRLSQELQKISTIEYVYPSDANFLLVRIKGGKKAYDYLISQLIIVRDRSKMALCQDCLRITVGTKSENEMLIEALKMYQPN